MDQTDIQNRKKILEEMNRQIIYNEATQLINPFTKKPYGGLTPNQIEVILYTEDLKSDVKPYHSPSLLTSSYSTSDLTKSFLWEGPGKKSTTEFIQYQLALAILDVKSGKMHENQYWHEEKNIRGLIRKLNDSGITLDIISSPDGLDAALKNQSKKAECEQKPKMNHAYAAA